MSFVFRRRTVPGSLRWLADKLLTEDLSEAERFGVAMSLRMIADELEPAVTDCVCGWPIELSVGDEETRRLWQHKDECPWKGIYQ